MVFVIEENFESIIFATYDIELFKQKVTELNKDACSDFSIHIFRNGNKVMSTVLYSGINIDKILMEGIK